MTNRAGPESWRIEHDRAHDKSKKDAEATVDEREVELPGRQPPGEPGRDEPPGLFLAGEEERRPSADVPEREPPPAFFSRFDEPQKPFFWRHGGEHRIRPRPALSARG